jgi:zinc protease
MDPAERSFHFPSRRVPIPPFAQGVIERGGRRGSVELSFHVGRFPEEHLLARAEEVEGDAKGDGPQPWVEADPGPGELVDPLDHLRVRLAEGVLRGGLRAEARQKDAAVEGGSVAMEQVAHRGAVPRLGAGHESSLTLESGAVVARSALPLHHARQTNGQRGEEGHDSVTPGGAAPLHPRRAPLYRAPTMRLACLACLGCLAIATAPLAASSPAYAAGQVSIPFTKTTLPNGMTVILSEDHTLPVVAVNVGYWVGSRVEEARQTGFAHLFEHLMFSGTRRAPRGYFDGRVEAVGGSSNAWTSEDRTDYYDDAPAGALGVLLWLEADRMRDLGPLLTSEKLDLQRDVIRSERRGASESAPSAVLELRLPALLFPEGHPYHHPVIGSRQDVEAAGVDDAKAFFARYYDPANASLSIAGDFEPKTAMDRIQAWFGTIPSHEAPRDGGSGGVPAFDPGATALKATVRETVEDDVELARTTMAWQAPKHFAPGDAELDLLADVLAKGKESRLYKALVYDANLAQDVSATAYSGVLASRFVVDATARPGVPLDRVEAAIDRELAKVRGASVSEAELVRAKNGIEAAFIERLQSPAARATILNDYQAELGDPGFAQRDLDRYRNATPGGVQDVAARFLTPNARVILRVVPRGTGPRAAKAPSSPEAK